MRVSMGILIAQFNVVAISGVLAGAFSVQFLEGELPCPLCLLQRMAMMLCALGPCFVLLKARQGEVLVQDYAFGYGLSILGAVVGMTISTRQILLHIVPPDPGFGDPVMGLHLYTWALVVFVVVLIDSALNLIFAPQLETKDASYNGLSKIVVGLFGLIVFANAGVTFFEEGFHWILPDNPERYELLYDLGIVEGPAS